jgi:membrane-associated protease RseP (regulator of RpoE activity)
VRLVHCVTLLAALSLLIARPIEPFAQGQQSSSAGVSNKCDTAYQPAWFGAYVEAINGPVGAKMGIKNKTGALVTAMTLGSPAAKSGLKNGDVIIAANGAPVTTPSDLTSMIEKRVPGYVLKLALIRDGQIQAVSVVLGTLPLGVQPAVPVRPKDQEVFAIANVFIDGFLWRGRFHCLTAADPANPVSRARVIGTYAAYAATPAKKFDMEVVRIPDIPCTFRFTPTFDDQGHPIDKAEPADSLAIIDFSHLTDEYHVRYEDGGDVRVIVRGDANGAVCDYRDAPFGDKRQGCHHDLVTVPMPPDRAESFLRSLRYIFSRVCGPAPLPPS